MKILILLMMFLLIGAFFIISQENLALKEKENIDKFVGDYYEWIGSIIDNTGSLTGYIIKMKWLPGEQLDSESDSD